MTNPIVPCLWFDGNAEEAMRFYVGILPDSSIDHINTSPADWPGGKAGDVLTVEATLKGAPYLALNGGSGTEFNDAISLQVHTGDQAETDRYWNALIADGGEEMACSWCKDRFGVRWQVVPRTLMEGLRSNDARERERVFLAMAEMVKIDVAAIEAARRGNKG
ncbi:2-polyprenyl-6-hydroxyphenol methylase [Alteripontixanthobacter maritimus]|uniref:2-polyprenyl-6-hydroxyphenol methylase n=1 Tax=Alteripontixanthobacter maritimus TaxID=2161824 RepID=A0A369Q7L1_9SPHN|nr:VOC family protein [Alteripontixanthobacter maritimus]RDC60452.1 2-polyprenyl-6-hydroxyphenol methylase [Alteripontixanthobacter maritimus]